MKIIKLIQLSLLISFSLAASVVHAEEDIITVARFNQIKDLAAAGWQVKE